MSSSHGGPWFSTKQSGVGVVLSQAVMFGGGLSGFMVSTPPLLSPEDGSISTCNAHAAGREAARRQSVLFQPLAALKQLKTPALRHQQLHILSISVFFTGWALIYVSPQEKR